MLIQELGIRYSIFLYDKAILIPFYNNMVLLYIGTH